MKPLPSAVARFLPYQTFNCFDFALSTWQVNMLGLGWTYEYLCEVITILTRNSSSPTSAADLNPIIKQLLTNCPGSSIFGVGGHSVLLSITDDIIAKASLKPCGRHVSYEQTIFKLLDRSLFPHIVQAFPRCHDIHLYATPQ